MPTDHIAYVHRPEWEPNIEARLIYGICRASEMLPGRLRWKKGLVVLASVELTGFTKCILSNRSCVADRTSLRRIHHVGKEIPGIKLVPGRTALNVESAWSSKRTRRRRTGRPMRAFYWRATMSAGRRRRHDGRGDCPSVLHRWGCPQVTRVRRRCVEEGLEAALGRKKQLRRRQTEAPGRSRRKRILVALACGRTAAGARRSWTTQAAGGPTLGGVRDRRDASGTETVRRALKKTLLKPWLKVCWCIPPKSECGLRVRHGGCAGSLPTRLRGSTRCWCVMDETSRPAGQGETSAASQSRAAGAPAMSTTTNTSACGVSQPVHAVRAPGGVAARRGDGATDPKVDWARVNQRVWWTRTTRTRNASCW